MLGRPAKVKGENLKPNGLIPVFNRVLPWSANCIWGRRPMDDSGRMFVRPKSAFMRLSSRPPAFQYRQAQPHHRKWAGVLVRFFFFLLKFLIFLAEALDSAGGINQLLLSGKKWMAFWADLNPDIGSGGSDLQNVATGTPNGGFLILWMNVSFHFISTPLRFLNF